MITTKPKTRVTGFHCRQSDKQAYRTLKRFMELTGATTEEALQTFIRYAAHGWQGAQGRALLTELVQQYKAQRPKQEITIHHLEVSLNPIYMTPTGPVSLTGPLNPTSEKGSATMQAPALQPTPQCISGISADDPYYSIVRCLDSALDGQLRTLAHL
jgi:hypothetical protein